MLIQRIRHPKTFETQIKNSFFPEFFFTVMKLTKLICLPCDLIVLIKEYVPKNQLNYLHRFHLNDYSDLSPEQLLSLECYNPIPYIQAAVQLQCTYVLQRFEWNAEYIAKLVEYAMDPFSLTMMDYAYDLIHILPRHKVAKVDFSEVFDNRNVHEEKAYNWFVAHGLWMESNLPINNAFKAANVTWFESLCTDYSLYLYRSIREEAIDILCLIATKVNLDDDIDTIFNSTFRVEHLQRIYDVMNLDTSQPLQISTRRNAGWLEFILDHFTVTNTQSYLLELFLHDARPYYLLLMHFKLDIATDYPISKRLWELSIPVLDKLYQYDPDIFHIDISACDISYKLFSKCIEYGSYISIPIIDIAHFAEGHIALLPEHMAHDYKLDTAIIDAKIDTLLRIDYLSNNPKMWLIESMLRRIPDVSWKYNILFNRIHGTTDKRIIERLDWSCMNYQELIAKNIPVTLFQIASPQTLVLHAISNNSSKLDLILGYINQHHRDFELDSLLVDLHWKNLSEHNRCELYKYFPDVCDKKEDSLTFQFLQRMKFKRQKK